MRMKPEKNQVTWGITIFILCLCLMMAYYIIFDWKSISEQISHILDAISGVLLGLVLAYILMPLMEGIERNILKPLYKKRGYDVSLGKNANVKKRSQMRKIAILITMIFFLIMVYTLFRIVLPQIISSVREIANNLPVYIKNIDEYSNLFLANNPELQQVIDASLDTYYATLSSFLTKNLIPLLPNVNTMVKIASQSFISIIKVIIDLIVGFIVAIYVLNSKERFSTRGKKMAYAMFKEENANELISGFRYVNYTFEGFIGGKMVDSLIICIICYIGCMLLGISLRLMLWISYAFVFLLVVFSPKDFLAVAFDSGGVTTGPMTVPFIMALGVGVSAIRSDRKAADDSFGLVALSSVGPILAVLVLSLIFLRYSLRYASTR